MQHNHLYCIVARGNIPSCENRAKSGGGRHASMKPTLMHGQPCDRSLSADCRQSACLHVAEQSRHRKSLEAKSLNFASNASNGATWTGSLVLANIQLRGVSKAYPQQLARLLEPVVFFSFDLKHALRCPARCRLFFTAMALGSGPVAAGRCLEPVGESCQR